MKPLYFFYLLEIAKVGGLFERVSISTTQIGERLGVSQQTASRRMKHLEKEDLITRDFDSSRTQVISLTEKGIAMLKKVHEELNVFFEKSPVSLCLKGRVLGGIGEGRYYVSKYKKFFEMNLNITPYPGTLNVRLLDETDILNRKKIELQGGILMKGFTDETRSFGDVWAYRVDISNNDGNGDEVEGYILKIKRTHYTSNIIEIISRWNLREKLHLQDGSFIKICYDSGS
ncbi:DUF120 domain-containing protein [Candidatus Bathyarchaeota archaeon]|nr:DUF120 domain-containing protein [Candidatus Bathyarchaeota archaeon]